MKLNLDIISDNLSKSFKVKRFGPKNSSLYLNRPLLYEVGCELVRDRLYVARADTLPRTPPKRGLAVVCVGLHPPQEWVSNGCQVLLIYNGPTLFSVFNEINKIYDKFDEWDSSLRNELEADADFDIKKFLKAGIMLLENPMVVINGTMSLIFHSEIATHGDNGFDIIVSDIYQPEPVEMYEMIKMIKNACRLEREIKVPYLSSVTTDGKKCYCNNLYPFGYFAGCIAITETHKPFRESDYSLADHFFGYFQKAYAKYLRSIPPIELPGTVAVKNLLNDMPLSTEELEVLALEARECWKCFKLRDKETPNYLPKEYMCTTINALMPGRVYSVIYDDEITGLIKLRLDENGSTDNTLDFFEEFLSKMDYIAGLSEEFCDINQTNIFMKQADYAVEIGSQICGEAHIYRFGDYALQYMVSRCTGEFSAEYLYSKGLRTLIEHDNNSHVNYLETLDVYLKNEMCITSTANELYLHRSSLNKRLDRIGRMLNADLEDPDVRLYLRICLYLIRKRTQ